MTAHDDKSTALPVLWTLPDVARALGIGMTKTRALVRTERNRMGVIESVRIGDRVLVRPDAVRAYVESLSAEQHTA
jgi:hypothetical protein